MRKFIDVLKAAASYTLACFLIFTGALWCYIFIVITLNAFWKLFATLFIVAVAVYSWDVYDLGAKLKRLWKRPAHKPSIIEGVLVNAK